MTPSSNAPPAATSSQPKRHKQTLLLWMGIYPTITTVLWFLLPLLQAHFPLPVITLIVTAIVVPLMSYVVMPFLQMRFASWVRR